MIDNKKSKRLARLPTLEQVKEGVEIILQNGWSDITFKKSPNSYIKKFEKVFIKNIGLLPYLILLSDTNKLHPFCYRIRKRDKFLNTSLIGDFSYPPKSLTSFKRANLPKSPVFYCSPDAKTALVETVRENFNDKDENIFFISEWNFREGYNLNIAPFIYGNTSNLNLFRNLSENVLSNFRNQLSQEEVRHYPVFIEILKFLASLFVYEESYAVSSFIAHSYLYAPHNLRADIFIYPSTQAEKHTINFAIHPNTVLQKMFLQKIFCFKLNRFKFYDNIRFQVDLKLINVGKNENGIIYWNSATENDFKDFKNIFPDLSEGYK